MVIETSQFLNQKPGFFTLVVAVARQDGLFFCAGLTPKN